MTQSVTIKFELIEGIRDHFESFEPRYQDITPKPNINTGSDGLTSMDLYILLESGLVEVGNYHCNGCFYIYGKHCNRVDTVSGWAYKE